MQDSGRAQSADCGCAGKDATQVTRRRFVGGAASALATAPLSAAGQSTPETEQPVASPSVAIVVDLEQVRAVSLALVGGGSLGDAGLQTLGRLISDDPDRVKAFEELAALDDPSAEEALGGVSRAARALAEEITGFWYLGEFDGMPVANRADLYFGLPVWATLPYSTQPTLCKAFGYWANEVTLD